MSLLKDQEAKLKAHISTRQEALGLHHPDGANVDSASDIGLTARRQ